MPKHGHLLESNKQNSSCQIFYTVVTTFGGGSAKCCRPPVLAVELQNQQTYNRTIQITSHKHIF